MKSENREINPGPKQRNRIKVTKAYRVNIFKQDYICRDYIQNNTKKSNS